MIHPITFKYVPEKKIVNYVCTIINLCKNKKKVRTQCIYQEQRYFPVKTAFKKKKIKIH